MTVWDSMNLNAPHTASELAAEADTTQSGTTEPQGATSPSAGLSGGSAGHDKSCHLRATIAAEKAEWPHAGVMHAAARTACDAIAERVKKLMGDA